MIPLKTRKEIAVMREGGKRLRWVLEQVLQKTKKGVKTKELDKQAEELITKQGGQPSFKMVPGYFWSTCISVNEVVVHGIPGERVLQEGDIVGLDMGMNFGGWHTDVATTVEVGRKKGEERRRKFLEAGRRALEAAIKKTIVGNFIGDLSLTIQGEIGAVGYSPVKVLTGHGVGRRLHEEPAIPCFLKGERKDSPKLKSGMTLAIEVIYNQGRPEVVLGEDGWTISTKDGKISGLFEETVAVTGDGPLILTR